MKKILIVFSFMLLLLLSNKFVSADHYLTFQSLDIPYGKLITEYSDSELEKHYKSVNKSKFAGWKTKKINNRVKTTFVSDTIFSYYNDGSTPIEYSYKSEESSTERYSFSSTGSVSTKINGDKKGFKGGLDASLKMSYSNDTTKTKKETYEVKMKVDPGTKTSLYYYGEGYLTNGVCANYFFWIRVNKGGFEIFEIGTKYYRLEKVRI